MYVPSSWSKKNGLKRKLFIIYMLVTTTDMTSALINVRKFCRIFAFNISCCCICNADEL